MSRECTSTRRHFEEDLWWGRTPHNPFQSIIWQKPRRRKKGARSDGISSLARTHGLTCLSVYHFRLRHSYCQDTPQQSVANSWTNSKKLEGHSISKLKIDERR